MSVNVKAIFGQTLGCPGCVPGQRGFRHSVTCTECRKRLFAEELEKEVGVPAGPGQPVVEAPPGAAAADGEVEGAQQAPATDTKMVATPPGSPVLVPRDSRNPTTPPDSPQARPISAPACGAGVRLMDAPSVAVPGSLEAGNKRSLTQQALAPGQAPGKRARPGEKQSQDEVMEMYCLYSDLVELVEAQQDYLQNQQAGVSLFRK